MDIGAMEQALLDLAQNESVKQNSMLDDKYQSSCNTFTSKGNVGNEDAIRESILCWNRRIFALKAT